MQRFKLISNDESFRMYFNVISTLKNKEITGVIKPNPIYNDLYYIRKRKKTSVFTPDKSIPDRFLRATTG
jgi:hypothetical protein